jgi:hypothetical protein
MAFCVRIERTSSEAQLFESLSALFEYVVKFLQPHRFDSVVAKALRDLNNCASDDVSSIPTQKAIFIFQHSVGCLASFFRQIFNGRHSVKIFALRLVGFAAASHALVAIDIGYYNTNISFYFCQNSGFVNWFDVKPT